MRVLQLASDKMGAGDDSLGELLILGFLEELVEQRDLPEKVVIYNSGVLLTKEGTSAAKAIAQMEKKGAEVLLCGTCINFYKLKSELGVGTISNMKAIVSAMNEADHIICP